MSGPAINTRQRALIQDQYDHSPTNVESFPTYHPEALERVSVARTASISCSNRLRKKSIFTLLSTAAPPKNNLSYHSFHHKDNSLLFSFMKKLCTLCGAQLFLTETAQFLHFILLIGGDLRLTVRTRSDATDPSTTWFSLVAMMAALPTIQFMIVFHEQDGIRLVHQIVADASESVAKRQLVDSHRKKVLSYMDKLSCLKTIDLSETAQDAKRILKREWGFAHN